MDNDEMVRAQMGGFEVNAVLSGLPSRSQLPRQPFFTKWNVRKLTGWNNRRPNFSSLVHPYSPFPQLASKWLITSMSTPSTDDSPPFNLLRCRLECFYDYWYEIIVSSIPFKIHNLYLQLVKLNGWNKCWVAE